MYHVAFTPEYSPSNGFSAKADTLTEAMAELLKSMATLDCEHWYLSFVLVTMQEAVQNLDDNKTAKSSWSDMGSPDDAFSIDIFTDADARYVRHDGDKLLAPHGAVGFVADPLHEQWLYDQAEIADWENVLIPKAIGEAIDQPQMRDIIANADHLQILVVDRKYSEIHAALVDDGFDVDIQAVMVVVDQLASSDPYFVRLAKTVRTM